jgi:hypothetical protein
MTSVMLAICANRLWFRKNLKSPTTNHVAVLRTEFDDPNFRFRTAEIRLLCMQRDVDERLVGLTDHRVRGCRGKQQSIPRRRNSKRRSTLQSVSTCRQLVTLDRHIRLTDNLVGDFCMVNVTIDQGTKFILGAVYIHPNVLQESIECFMFQMLGAYSEAIRLIFPSMNHDIETPILLCGDFNTDVTQNNSFVDFMKSTFNLECRSSASTILGNTFTRNVSVQTLPYVSYFSYHRPGLNRLIL